MRGAATRLAAQEARRSRQLPAAAVGAAQREAMRAGPTLAMQPRDGAQCAGAGMECAVAAAGLLDVPRVGTKRPVGVAEDGRGTVRARLIL